MSEEYYNQSQLLKKGFSKAMIRKLLPKPKLQKHTYYQSSPPIKKWEKTVVDSVMETVEYKEELEKSKQRKEVSKKGAATRRNRDEKELQDFLKTFRLKRVLSIEELNSILDESVFDDSLDYTYGIPYGSYDFFNEYSNNYYDSEKYFYSMKDVTKYTFPHPNKNSEINECVINYIYNYLIEYDDSLFDIEYRTNRLDWQIKKEETTYNLIASTYPSLANECNQLLSFLIDKITEEHDNRYVWK
ncbi:hypothetical protein [Ruminococcus sp. JL13D9]|uniref:hypothetical protein n=1 Tax=Ruminococcus sp. JL13D9 TaxID=3233381 RepID=UPI00389B21D6